MTVEYKDALYNAKIHRVKHSNNIDLVKYDTTVIDIICYIYGKSCMEVTNDYADVIVKRKGA